MPGTCPPEHEAQADLAAVTPNVDMPGTCPPEREAQADLAAVTRGVELKIPQGSFSSRASFYREEAMVLNDCMSVGSENSCHACSRPFFATLIRAWHQTKRSRIACRRK